jgi:hypothetical protein
MRDIAFITFYDNVSKANKALELLEDCAYQGCLLTVDWAKESRRPGGGNNW